MKDLMIDLETLGTGNNSVITQIGACYFNRVNGEIGDKFLVNISIEESIAAGFEVDGGAIQFWFQQDKSNMTFLNEPKSILEAMEMFRAFSKKAKRVWSHATFDFVLLTNLYLKMKQKLPVHYSTTRDIRTLVDLADCGKDDDAVREDAHDALRDCIYQVSYCVKAMNKIILTDDLPQPERVIEEEQK